MPRNRNLGECQLCHRDLSKSGASRHLKLCRRQNPPQPAGASQSLHITITDSFGGGAYWLQLEAPAHAPLSALDKFLRQIWMNDCPAHLSAFYIRNSEYISHMPQDDDDPPPSARMGFTQQPMDSITIGQAAERGTLAKSLAYKYDLAAPTQLALRTYEDRWPDGNGQIRLLARNNAPAIPCAHCNAPATRHAPYAGGPAPSAALCDDCAANQPGGTNSLPPIANSPRSGARGHTVGEPDSQA